MKTVVALLIVIALAGCQPGVDLNKAAYEVYKAEADFAAAADRSGLAAAFYEFAAEEAVINRKMGLFKGEKPLRRFTNPSIKRV